MLTIKSANESFDEFEAIKLLIWAIMRILKILKTPLSEELSNLLPLGIGFCLGSKVEVD